MVSRAAVFRMANQASEFISAHQRMMVSAENTVGLIESFPGVGIVLLAFGCEIALKALLGSERGEFPREHRLDVLFSKLTPESQDRIKAQAWQPDNRKNWSLLYVGSSAVSKSNVTFESMLADHSRAFEHWRYSFEHDQLQALPEFLVDLATATLARLVAALAPPPNE